MRLQTLRIQNFRCFSDATISFGDETSLIGENGAGKSTILAALNVLFRNSAAPTDVVNLSSEDFHCENIGDPVVITATFVDLSEEAKQDFKHYVRNEQLIIVARATWSTDSNCAHVLQYGARLQVPDFSTYFDADGRGDSAAELRQIYAELRQSFPELPAETVKKKMHDALASYGEEHPDRCVPVEAEDQFYGWSRGSNRLAKYIQWVYVPAVKEASAEQEEARNSALGDLLQRTIRANVNFEETLESIRKEALDKYNQAMKDQNGALASVQQALEVRVREWTHPNVSLELEWAQDEAKAISITEPFARAALGEGPFTGDLGRLGHGLQRAFIISLLQELAEHPTEGTPTLILGIEEPELYQHPPQARHFSSVLHDLASTGSQVIFTTHSSLFVSPSHFESIRVVRKCPATGASSIIVSSLDAITKMISSATGDKAPSPSSFAAMMEQIVRPEMAELFFCRIPVLVEGAEDVAIIAAYLRLTNQWLEFRKFGFHFIPCDGKTNLSRPLAMALSLGMPAFVVFDGDTNDAGNEARHRKDNGCILRLCKASTAETFPDTHYWGDRVVMWSQNIQAAIKEEIGPEKWTEAMNGARDAHGLQDGIKKKNRVLLAATIAMLHDEGIAIGTLQKLVQALFEYGEAVTAT